MSQSKEKGRAVDIRPPVVYFARGRQTTVLKAITFDFWYTLFDDVGFERRIKLRADFIFEVLQPYGFADRRALDEAVAADQERFSRVWRDEHRTLPVRERLETILTQIGVPSAIEEYQRIIDFNYRLEEIAPPRPVNGAKKLLANLAPRYKLGIISDTGLTEGWFLRKTLAAHGMLEHFSATIFSDEVGRSKPHGSCFEAALAALDVAPEEALHVGDLQRSDIAGAQSAGMKAILFTGINGRDAQTTTADAVTADYADFEEALARISDGR